MNGFAGRLILIERGKRQRARVFEICSEMPNDSKYCFAFVLDGGFRFIID